MSVRNLLLQYWDFCLDQEDWYPPLMHALKDVTFEQALWKPEIGAANSIWENVQHLLYFKERLLKRLSGVPDEQHAGNDETFLIPEASKEAWENVKSRMLEVHSSLRHALEQMSEEEIETKPQRFMSLITHDAYHTGQIILLAKLQGSWPANRSYL
ncbi:DinB family protein [Paenibacillus sp. HJL G12]|uniref:DinB family protein n=1 Tax=Paenibacillus dendrobii TaxID=2691084 RepID=A0A7X3LGU8_9BACL|nr:DinB family protein [Paenibacillus dendrobii]MWV44437.1 DinB family protein [Paenibacillus dendrobii]